VTKPLVKTRHRSASGEQPLHLPLKY